MTGSAAKKPSRAAEQCDVNIHSLSGMGRRDTATDEFEITFLCSIAESPPCSRNDLRLKHSLIEVEVRRGSTSSGAVLVLDHGSK
ncbi:hypothetical protein TNCV_4121751 [Trichonephila clavipes]|nr:hypothetical protein TNCV_4121751 [Trichonephila clavipes]